MPAPATVPEFLELVRKSGLAPENKLEELLGRYRATGSPQTVDQAAAILVRDSQLTFFQSKQLKLGRYKRFTIGSKYRLLELIGVGGMGAVYLCEHTLMKRLVALKVLPVEKLDDHSNLERFHREGRAVGALDHPNIVRAHDVDQFEKLHFLVMEYVDGHSLQEIIARYAMENQFFDPIRAAHYIAQAAVGMQYAHELGMVHRDIKPGNLLLDRTGVIKVLDMGLARFFNKQQDSVTERYDERCVLGTADYLAPEQAVSNVVDLRADIYSLGGTFYFMLTGQTPFPDGTIAAKLVAHQTREPRPVESFRSDVPPEMLAVLRRMMAKSVADRYQQPIEVAEALAEWADQPIPPPPEREMPILCPLVQALANPGTDRSGSQTPLARALFAPGRGVFGRMGDRLSESSTTSSSSNAAFPISPPSRPRYSPSPASTLRATAAQTAPNQPNPTSSAGSGSANGKGLIRASPRLQSKKPEAVKELTPRRGVALAIKSLVLGILLAAATGIGYQMGKDSRHSRDEVGSNQPAIPLVPSQTSSIPAPRASDYFLNPLQAATQLGEEQSVELKVRSVTGANHLDLQAEIGAGAPFVVRIAAKYFTAATVHEADVRRQAKQHYEGKLIRVRGVVRRDPHSQGVVIEVEHPESQIAVVEARSSANPHN